MNAMGMGAIISGFYDGLDKQNEINYRDSERKHDTARRTITESRQDTAYGQQQQDRTHDIARRDINDTRSDTQYGEQQAQYAHALERQPIVEGQQDQQFGLGVAKTQLDMSLAKNQDKRADSQLGLQQAEFGSRQRLQTIQTEMAQMGLDDAKVAQGYKHAEQQLTPLFQQYEVNKDPTIFQDWYNQHVPDGNQVQIQKNDDGSFQINSQRGTSQKVGSGDEIARMARTLVRPDVYMESLYAGEKAKQAAAEARAKDPKNFGEPVQGTDGTQGMLDYSSARVTPITGPDGQPFRGSVPGKGEKPAMLQEVDALMQNLPPQQGESPTDRWMRAYATANRRLSADPQQAAADFYGKTLTKLLPNSDFETPSPEKLKVAQTQASALTQQFASQYLGGGQGAPRASGPLAGMAANTVNTQPTPASGRSNVAATQPASAAAPQRQAQFVEGQLYRDGSGATARYTNGQFVPVQP